MEKLRGRRKTCHTSHRAIQQTQQAANVAFLLAKSTVARAPGLRARTKYPKLRRLVQYTISERVQSNAGHKSAEMELTKASCTPQRRRRRQQSSPRGA